MKTAASPRELIEVALPLPLQRTFTYAWPEDAGRPPRGGRVVVGFNRRRMVGFVAATGVEAPAGVRVRPIQRVVDREAVLSPTEWRLAEWLARYYVAPLGLVLKLFHPPGATYDVREGSAATVAAPVERLHVLPVGALDRAAIAGVEADLSRAPQQRRAWDAARGLEAPAPLTEFARAVEVSEGVIRALADRGLVHIELRAVSRDPYDGGEELPETGREGPLTELQRTAVDAVRGALAGDSERGPVLLQGITGSGKTRVYLEAASAAVEGGGAVIVLVPEIGLAGPVVSRFRRRFGERVAVLHSGLSDGERQDAWRRVRAGQAPVVVGARSALFAPVGKAALIVVDEEHETAYKQDETPRYLARDVAVYRAALEGGVALLGSATPSLETRSNADAGKYRHLRLGERIGRRPLPAVEIVDLTQSEIVGPGLSAPLATALEETLGAGDQALLFLNRRGFSTFLQCTDCGWVARCPNCAISLTFHRAGPALLCHYCAHRAEVPASCPKCAGRRLDTRGVGTQQVESAVRARLPDARVARMDLDTTGGKWSHARIYRAMQRREIDVLVGTQMIAKGFDLPGVALVGVVSADTALHFPDFRATERTFQLLVQVAGRAGRGDRPGRVLLQTYVSDRDVIAAAAGHDYEGFYRHEMERRRGLGYPPATRLANVVVSGEDEAAVETGVERVAARLAARRAPGLTAVGPAPCPIERLRGRSRHHLLLKATSPAALDRALWDLAHREDALVGSGCRLELDRDPLSLL